MNDRFRNVLLALVFGALAAVLVVVYVRNYKHHVNVQGSLVRVLVATSDLQPGTRGSSAVSHVKFESILRSQVVQGAVSTKSDIEQLFVSQPIYAGEQLTSRRFGAVEDTGVRGEITGYQRLIQVAGDNDQLLAGTLQAGDYVDVVASVKLPSAAGGDQAVTRTILRRLRVLQPASKSSSSGIAGGSSSTSVMLAVNDSDVAKLFYVLKNADWSLVLRPRFAASSPTSAATAGSVLGGK